MEFHHPVAGVHPHGAMRREDRLITDPTVLNTIIQRGHLMHLALCDENIPFLVPVFYAYDGTALYFHSARAGTKISILQKNPAVCFEISEYAGVIPDPVACNFEARHRTVIGIGRACFLGDPTEKINALNRIVAQFTAQQFTFPEASLRATTVIRIDIDSMKGKQHGFGEPEGDA